MGHEATLPLGDAVELDEAIPVAVHAEVGDGPDDLPQEVDDGTHVEELDPQGFRPKVDDHQARVLGLPSGSLRTANVRHRLWAHEELGELVVRTRADVLGEVATTRSQQSGDLVPSGHTRMAAQHEVARAVLQGHVCRVWDLEHRRPERRQVLAGQDEVGAPSLGGGDPRGAVLAWLSTSAKTSPPPVWMSRTERARWSLSVAPRL